MNKVVVVIVLLAWQVFQIKVRYNNKASYSFLDVQIARATMINNINDKTSKVNWATIGKNNHSVMFLSELLLGVFK